MIRFRQTTLAVLAAATLTLPLAAGEASAATCAGASASPGQASRVDLSQAMLCEINVVRRSHGLGAVRANRRLERAARRHSRDMVKHRYFSHTTPGGVTMVQRIRRTDYLRHAHAWTVGENLAWGAEGLGSVRSVVRAWMHSPEHRMVLLTPSFTEVGIGVVLGAPRRLHRPAATYTADFGVKRR